MKNLKIALAIDLLLGATISPLALGQTVPPAITEQEAHTIAVDAYI